MITLDLLFYFLLGIPDSVTAKGAGYTSGYIFGGFLPFLVLAIIATIIIVRKRKS